MKELDGSVTSKIQELEGIIWDIEQNLSWLMQARLPEHPQPNNENYHESKSNQKMLGLFLHQPRK